jgi:hypothetical protein
MDEQLHDRAAGRDSVLVECGVDIAVGVAA